MNGSNTHKGKFKRNQLQLVYNALKRQPMTMKQVSMLTGIDRANICRYCRTFRIQNKVCYLKKVVCPITKNRAFLITTNEVLFTND